jgi:glycosyltransferase involved in cell wall biosynthesis
MHIVSILTSLTSGGAEMLVVNLNKEYVAAGHRSTIVTLADADSVGNSPEMEAILHQRIVDEGGEHISLHLGTSRNPIKGWRKMRHLVRQLNPDVIHAHTARALLMVMAHPGKAPVVLTHHNSKLSFPVAMFRIFDQIADAYVAISKETETIFAQNVRRPIAYIPNAASKSFSASAPRARANASAQILSVGTISAQKHYDLLVEVAVALKNRIGIAAMPKFMIAGNGVDLENMRMLAQERGVADHVHFLGERSDIAQLMQSSDLYLNSSRYEGMPVALLEAMASGLPIIATKVAGNTELVGHMENGLLCALDDAQDLAGAISKLIDDDALYSRCSAAAIERSKSFSIEATCASHLALYQKIRGV